MKKGREIKIQYLDGFIYSDIVDFEGEVDREDPWGHHEVDAVSLSADMDYVTHKRWPEDFDSLNRADEHRKSLWIDGELYWQKFKIF